LPPSLDRGASFQTRVRFSPFPERLWVTLLCCDGSPGALVGLSFRGFLCPLMRVFSPSYLGVRAGLIVPFKRDEGFEKTLYIPALFP